MESDSSKASRERWLRFREILKYLHGRAAADVPANLLVKTGVQLTARAHDSETARRVIDGFTGGIGMIDRTTLENLAGSTRFAAHYEVD